MSVKTRSWQGPVRDKVTCDSVIHVCHARRKKKMAFCSRQWRPNLRSTENKSLANAGSQINFWTFSETHTSKSDLKNGHISRFCSVFQAVQVVSSAKFFSAEEVDISFISWIWIHEFDFKGFFLEKRSWERFFIKCSNSGINESTTQTQNNVIWISSKENLKISFLNSLLEKWVWECSRKIDPATS